MRDRRPVVERLRLRSPGLTAMRAPRYALVFGILAILGLPLNPPITGCLGNPLFFVFAGFACLGFVLGLIGLMDDHRGRAVAAIILSVASPIVAWTLAPRLVGGRGEESSVIGDIRTVLSGQDAFKSANDGFYGTPGCLTRPSACLPGYPSSGPVFMDSLLASGQQKAGYDRRFVAGPPAPNGQRWSMTSYAYVAVPARQRSTGVRAFCGDSSGAICFTQGGEIPPVVAGHCITTEADRNSPCNPLN